MESMATAYTSAEVGRKEETGSGRIVGGIVWKGEMTSLEYEFGPAG